MIRYDFMLLIDCAASIDSISTLQKILVVFGDEFSYGEDNETLRICHDLD